RFRTHCDTELLPHLWEDHGEDMFRKLRGQFAVALWDSRRRHLLLARDRFGICPLYWTRQGDWLLFASEIKAFFASGLVKPRTDIRGLNHLFTFFSQPGPVTCFEGIQMLAPGHFIRLDLSQRPGRMSERTYWQIDFPDQGDEESGQNETKLVDQFES